MPLELFSWDHEGIACFNFSERIEPEIPWLEILFLVCLLIVVWLGVWWFLCYILVPVAGCDHCHINIYKQIHFQNCVSLCLSFQNLMKFYKSVNWNQFFGSIMFCRFTGLFLKLTVLSWVCYLFLLYLMIY